jgi:hypothetical protein
MNGLYQVVLALHILGAFGLVGSIGMEALVVRGLSRATTAEEGRPFLGAYQILRILAPASLLVILIAGLYMTAAVWHWTGWNVVGILGLIAIGAIWGSVNGRKMAQIGPLLGWARGVLTEDVRGMISGQAFRLSLWARIGIVIGVVFVMTLKPGFLASLAIVVIAAGAGLAYALLPARQNVGSGSNTRTPSAAG